MDFDDLIPSAAQKLSVDDLPENLQFIAEAVGVETALRVSQHCGGLVLYIPKIENILVPEIHERIQKEFTGANHRDLARKYGVSDNWIRSILKKGRGERHNR